MLQNQKYVTWLSVAIVPPFTWHPQLMHSSDSRLTQNWHCNVGLYRIFVSFQRVMQSLTVPFYTICNIKGNSMAGMPDCHTASRHRLKALDQDVLRSITVSNSFCMHDLPLGISSSFTTASFRWGFAAVIMSGRTIFSNTLFLSIPAGMVFFS